MSRSLTIIGLCSLLVACGDDIASYPSWLYVCIDADNGTVNNTIDTLRLQVDPQAWTSTDLVVGNGLNPTGDYTSTALAFEGRLNQALTLHVSGFANGSQIASGCASWTQGNPGNGDQNFTQNVCLYGAGNPTAAANCTSTGTGTNGCPQMECPNNGLGSNN